MEIVFHIFCCCVAVFKTKMCFILAFVVVLLFFFLFLSGMSEYLKDLERMKPGDPMPPINTGPYDNPLLWNMLDPFAADRGHQRRPLTISRDTMEYYQVPYSAKDHCMHRFLPYRYCYLMSGNQIGNINCHEFESALTLCLAFEHYRNMLVKNRFLEYAKDYTEEDKAYFPSLEHVFPYYLGTPWTSITTSALASGWDENDPANPMTWREPNRALWRAQFNPTNWERTVSYQALGLKITPQDVVRKHLPSFPLPNTKEE